jgi:hypothetical protein
MAPAAAAAKAPAAAAAAVAKAPAAAAAAAAKTPAATAAAAAAAAKASAEPAPPAVPAAPAAPAAAPRRAMTKDEHRLANLARIVDIVVAYRGYGKGLQYGVRSTLQGHVNEEAGRTRVDALDVPAERVIELWMARLSPKVHARVMARVRRAAAAAPAPARVAAAAAPVRARVAAMAAPAQARAAAAAAPEQARAAAAPAPARLHIAHAAFQFLGENSDEEERERERDFEDSIRRGHHFNNSDEEERVRWREIEVSIQGRSPDADERRERWRADRELGYCHDQRLCGDGDDDYYSP